MKVWIAIGATLAILGSVAFCILGFACGWNFRDMFGGKFVTAEISVDEEFGDISINTDTIDIFFEKSEDNKAKVVSYDKEKLIYKAEVKDGALKICVEDRREWFEKIFNMTFESRLTVYLPEGEYGALVVKESTGDIEIAKDFIFDNIEISLSTGNTALFASAKENIRINGSTGSVLAEGISAESFETTLSTGGVTVKDSFVYGDLCVKVSTGNVQMNKVNFSGEVNITVSTGDCKLLDVNCDKLLSEGSTGDIYMQNVIAKDKVDIKRSTGDVEFDGCDAAEIYVDTDTGSVKGSLLSDKVFIVDTDTGRKEVPETVTGGKCKISTDTGDIVITVKNSD